MHIRFRHLVRFLNEFLIKNINPLRYNYTIHSCSYSKNNYTVCIYIGLSILFIIALIVFVGNFYLKAGWFLSNSIPLGYDPGLYKSMFEAYFNLSSYHQLDQLPHRIKSMYEPFLGILWNMVQYAGVHFSDNWLTRWRATISSICLIAVYITWSSINKQTAVRAFIISNLSFAQYASYWRAYRKQILGLCFICTILRAREKKRILQSIPLVIAAFVVNRAAGLILILTAAIRALISYQNKKTAFQLIWLFFVAGLGSLPLMLPFRDQLISIYLWPLFHSFVKHQYNDGYQAGWTFLSIGEYIKLSRVTIITGITWLILIIKKNKHIPLAISTIILIIRVLFQGFFFQRMIWYLDLLLCVCAWYSLSIIFSKSLGAIIIWCILSLQSYNLRYWYSIIHPPLITKQEFQAIQLLWWNLSVDSIIIVPGIWYSPRIQGWTKSQVLAPGLFDLNKRWNATQERSNKRYNQSAKTKCQNLKADYPQLTQKPTYVRIGSKQWEDDYKNACFVYMSWSLLPNYKRYQIDRSKIP